MGLLASAEVKSFIDAFVSLSAVLSVNISPQLRVHLERLFNVNNNIAVNNNRVDIGSGIPLMVVVLVFMWLAFVLIMAALVLHAPAGAAGWSGISGFFSEWWRQLSFSHFALFLIIAFLLLRLGEALRCRQPVGTVISYVGVWNDAVRARFEATGWYLADGRVMSSVDFPVLAGVLGVLHGNGAGVQGVLGQFNLPQMCGRFERGVDHGHNIDPEAGTRPHPQAPQVLSAVTEAGSLQSASVGTHGHQCAVNVVDPGHTHDFVHYSNGFNIGGRIGGSNNSDNPAQFERMPGNNGIVTAQTGIQVQVQVAQHTTPENRPANIAVHKLILCR